MDCSEKRKINNRRFPGTNKVGAKQYDYKGRQY
jgi:hypothetical protein